MTCWRTGHLSRRRTCLAELLSTLLPVQGNRRWCCCWSRGLDKDAWCVDGWTPLYAAIKNDQEAAALALLAAGAVVNLQCGTSLSTVLHAAVDNGSVGILRAVIEHGSDVDPGDSVRNTALHGAAASDKVDTIVVPVEAGANIEASGEYDGATPLRAAADMLRPGALLSLLNHGVHVNAQNSWERRYIMQQGVPGHKELRRWWTCC